MSAERGKQNDPVAGIAGRSDGRAVGELRPVELIVDFTENPLGSVLCSLGRTKVLCTVSEEQAVPRWMRGNGRGWITAEYSMLPGSTDRRSEREASRGRLTGRTQEIQRLIGRSLRAVTNLEALGQRTLWVDCDVLQADGGTRTASITGAYTAIARACQRLLRRGGLERDPLRDSVAAVSVGVVAGQIVLDLSYQEDAGADVDMNVVGTGAGQLVEVQGTAEGACFTERQLAELTSLALRGIRELSGIQREALLEAEQRG